MPEFKEWYNEKKKYVEQENRIRGGYSRKSYNKYDASERHLIISFCPFCDSYGICYNEYNCVNFSLIICKNCKNIFCIGCLREPSDILDYTICLKGYFILLYHRIKDRRSDNIHYGPRFYFFHIIACLFLTPIYLGIISSYLGFLFHRKRKQFFLNWY